MSKKKDNCWLLFLFLLFFVSISKRLLIIFQFWVLKADYDFSCPVLVAYELTAYKKVCISSGNREEQVRIEIVQSICPKQLLVAVLLKTCFWTFCKIHRCIAHSICSVTRVGSSPSQMFLKIQGVLKTFAIFTGKHLSWILLLMKTCNFLKKRLQLKCFPFNIVKFLKIPFFIE